jgi:hypothetical protein
MQNRRKIKTATTAMRPGREDGFKTVRAQHPRQVMSESGQATMLQEPTTRRNSAPGKVGGKQKFDPATEANPDNGMNLKTGVDKSKPGSGLVNNRGRRTPLEWQAENRERVLRSGC